jgi:hypothetical protein
VSWRLPSTSVPESAAPFAGTAAGQGARAGLARSCPPRETPAGPSPPPDVKLSRPGLRRTLRGVALAAVVCAAWPSPSAADVVELTTGQKLVGVIKGITAKGLVIEVQGRERTIAQRLVLSLAFGPARPASPPAGAAPTPAAVALPVAAAPPPPADPAPTPAESPTAPGEPAAPPEPGPTPPAAKAAEATPPAPSGSTIVLARLSPSTLRDAIQALLDLRAVAVPGTSPAEYKARVVQATPIVDRYRADDGDPRADLKRALTTAMRLYAFAAAAWSVYAEKGDLAGVGRDPAIAECPQLQRSIARDAADWKFKADNPAFAGLIAGSEGLPDLWACASDRLDAVAKLLAGPAQ